MGSKLQKKSLVFDMASRMLSNRLKAEDFAANAAIGMIFYDVERLKVWRCGFDAAISL